MKLDELFTDDKAVSPVVGVALLIAMTVILAAVIGTVVLGLGSNPAQAPQATFSFEDVGTNGINVVHDGGDALPADEITIIRVDDAGATTTEDLTTDYGYGADEEWTAGEDIDVGDGNTETVRVVWEDQDSDKTSTLAEYSLA